MSSVLTDTPQRNKLAEAKTKRKAGTKSQAKVVKRKGKPSRQLFQESSSSDSETEMQLNDDSGSDIGQESPEEIIEGDFLIVKVRGKSRVLNYTARVDVADGDDLEGVFLQRMLARNKDTPVFVLNTKDQALWSRQDVLKKLPVPSVSGSSRRSLFRFNCNLDDWNLQ